MDDNNADLDLRSGFTLGPWTVLPNQNRIEGEPDAVHLEPKVMEVLCVLARQQGEVVSRNDLLEEVWKGSYVTDEVLSRAISVLRSQLGDDRKNPEYIVTVPKAGYRLIKGVVPTHTQSGEQATVPAPEASPPFRRNWLPHATVAVLLLLLLVVGYLFKEQAPPPPLDPRSPTLFADLSDWFELIIRGDTAPEAVTDIAVLPFDDISEQAGNAFLSDGLTDELINSLGQLEGLKVVARSSSLSFRNRHEDVREIGDFLNVHAVVEGTVKRSGDRIRICAQLSSTRDGYVLWSQTFDSDLQDMLALQAEIANEIVSALREKLELDDLQLPVIDATLPDMQAYQLYLNGRFLWKLRGESPLRRSIVLFEQALQLDAGFTRARLALVNSLILLPYYSGENEEDALGRALAILDEITMLTPKWKPSRVLSPSAAGSGNRPRTGSTRLSCWRPTITISMCGIPNCSPPWGAMSTPSKQHNRPMTWTRSPRWSTTAWPSPGCGMVTTCVRQSSLQREQSWALLISSAPAT